MPIYEFRCPAGHVTERLVPMDTPSVECPRCEQLPESPTVAERILSATPTNFHFADQLKR